MTDLSNKTVEELLALARRANWDMKDDATAFAPFDELASRLTKTQAEIARMRPVVDLAIAARAQGLLPMYLDIAIGDYEAGEKP